MKYLRRYLLHAGLCLLLVCSANVASAQSEQIVVSLEAVSTTQTLVSRTIDFTVSLSRPLTGNEVLFSQIAPSFNVLKGEIESVSLLTDYTVTSRNCLLFGRLHINSGTTARNLCMDVGEQNATLRLVLNSSFDRRKTITLTLFINNFLNITPAPQTDPDASVLRYPGPAIFMRIKVFLEGALQ